MKYILQVDVKSENSNDNNHCSRAWRALGGGGDRGGGDRGGCE